MQATIYKFKWKENPKVDFQNLFLELKHLCFPLYKYKQGNCHNLMHFCSIVLNDWGVSHKKIWIYAPVRLGIESKKCIRKPDPNGLSLSGNVNWGFHVAILFEEGNDLHIFDWILNENVPMTTDDWLMSMGLTNYKIDIVDSENYLFYPIKDRQENRSKKGINYFKYEAECKKNNWVPAGLAINETAYEFLINENDILFGQTEITKDYKILVGSIITFESVIRDQILTKRVNEQFLHKHHQLIHKYREIYQSKLIKWKSALEFWE